MGWLFRLCFFLLLRAFFTRLFLRFALGLSLLRFFKFGPFLLAPLSEMFGRVVVLQSANMFYLIFNTVCGFSKTKEQMLVFRFLSGLGGSAPQAV